MIREIMFAGQEGWWKQAPAPKPVEKKQDGELRLFDEMYEKMQPLKVEFEDGDEPMHKIKVMTASRQRAIELVKDFWASALKGQQALFEKLGKENAFEREVKVKDFPDKTKIVCVPTKLSGIQYLVCFIGSEKHAVCEDTLLWCVQKGILKID